MRIVGAIEVHGGPEGCATTSATSRRAFPSYQDLGPGSTRRGLAASGFVGACRFRCGQIRDGSDLAALSAFGEPGAARSGLKAAFVAAIDARIPVLAAVAPRFAEEWGRFAGSLAVMGAPEADVIERWWCDAQRGSAPS